MHQQGIAAKPNGRAKWGMWLGVNCRLMGIFADFLDFKTALS
jgi:hypothetical protein